MNDFATRFPIMTAKLAEGDARNAAAAALRRRPAVKHSDVARFEQVVAKLDEATAAGVIANVDYKDLKDIATRFIDRVLNLLRDASRGDQPYWEMSDEAKAEYDVFNNVGGIYSGLPAFVSSGFKKLDRMPKGLANVAKVRTFLTEIEPVAKMLADLKGKVVKKQAKPAEENDPRYIPPMMPAAAVKIVRDVMEKLVEAEFEAMQAQFRETYYGYLNNFTTWVVNETKWLADHGKEPTISAYYGFLNDMFKKTHCASSRFHDPDEDKVILATVALEKNRWNQPVAQVVDGTVKLVENHDGVIAAMAMKEATYIRDCFVAKNVRKLASIVDAKGNFTEAKVVSTSISLNGLTGAIHFSFADGAEFLINNKIIWKTSTRGKNFNQFPLTFHSVKLAGGVKMPSPSEKRVNTVFLGKQES